MNGTNIQNQREERSTFIQPHFMPLFFICCSKYSSCDRLGTLSLGFAGFLESSVLTVETVANSVSGSGVATGIVGRIGGAAGTGAFFATRTFTIRAGLIELEINSSEETGLVTLSGASTA